MKIGIITGSGFYELENIKNLEERSIETIYGNSVIEYTKLEEHELFFIARHGKNHEYLPNMINYRANLMSLKKAGVELIITTSIMGILDKNIPLATLLLFNDLYFIDNRLPNGELCTMFTESGVPGRGHYMFGSPFSLKANELAQVSAQKNGLEFFSNLIHAHANGPRFNSKSEIKHFISTGAATVSQTVGPEIILAGECEIPYLMLGYGVDYANGISETPTPVEELNKNMALSKEVFNKMIFTLINELPSQADQFYNGFVYKFN